MKTVTYKYTTAAEEKAERLMIQAAEADVYRFEPVLMDRMGGCRVERGQLVVKTQPYGCPKNGTMGQCYVAEVGTGRFLQMVCENSLQLVERRKRRGIK